MGTSKPRGGYHQSALWALYGKLAGLADRRIGWHRLPVPLGLAVLAGLRDVLRKDNLYDTSALPAVNLPPVPPAAPEDRSNRSLDGTYNDLGQPRMGMAGSRFGRNVPLARVEPDPLPRLMQPSPRDVSRALLTRDELIPATSVNALVATWLQFMIKDWFSHGKGPRENPWEIPLTDDDPWPDRPMRVMRTRPDPTAPPGGNHPPTHTNTETPWWDASQIYGTTLEQQRFIRTGQHGKLRVSHVSTTPSATGFARSTLTGPTTRSTSGPAWPTPPSSRRSTRWSGRPPSSATPRPRSRCAPTGGAWPGNGCTGCSAG